MIGTLKLTESFSTYSFSPVQRFFHDGSQFAVINEYPQFLPGIPTEMRSNHHWTVRLSGLNDRMVATRVLFAALHGPSWSDYPVAIRRSFGDGQLIRDSRAPTPFGRRWSLLVRQARPPDKSIPLGPGPEIAHRLQYGFPARRSDIDHPGHPEMGGEQQRKYASALQK